MNRKLLMFLVMLVYVWLMGAVAAWLLGSGRYLNLRLTPGDMLNILFSAIVLVQVAHYQWNNPGRFLPLMIALVMGLAALFVAEATASFLVTWKVEFLGWRFAFKLFKIDLLILVPVVIAEDYLTWFFRDSKRAR